MLFDLKACSYIDSAGLGALMTLQKSLRGKGAVAVVGANPHVRRLLDIVGLRGTDSFEVFNDMADVRSALVARI